MNPEDLQREAAHRRTLRRTTGISIGVHALLLVWLIQGRAALQAGGGGLSEITLLDPGEFGGGIPAAEAPPAPAAAAPETHPGALVEHRAERHFARATTSAVAAPEPQSDAALSDRLESRLATLQRTPNPVLQGLSADVGGARLLTPAGIPGGTGSGGNGPVALRRGGPVGGGTGSGTGSGLVLGRGPRGSAVAELAQADLPVEKPSASRPQRAEAGAVRRTIAGASLAGPIADRPVLVTSLPEYPDWAKSDGVEASVTLYFLVLPDGRVKDNVMVQKTAGFGDFDDSACAALRAWRFESLPAGHAGEQWGTITFHFRLRDAR